MASIGTTRDESGNVIETKYRRILTEIPAPGTIALLERLAAVEPKGHEQVPIVWEDAFDYQVDDIAGNRFIDFTSGIFVANVGHGNIRVRDAIERAIETLFHSYTFATEIRLKYLEALTKWSGFEKAHLVCSGTEAVESAQRIMRCYGSRFGTGLGILYVGGAYHGRTLGARMGGINDYQQLVSPYVPTASFGLCGVMLETFEGWSASFHPKEWVQEIASFCKDRGLLLCFDEMQAGFARTGRKWGFEHYEVTPDLVCFGKAAGGGLPLSGVLGPAKLLDLDADLSSTHGGNPIACAAGIEVLKEIGSWDLVREAERKGKLIEVALWPLTILGIDFRGEGMIRALLFPERLGAPFVRKVVERCYEKGLLLISTGRESIKIGPPLTITDEALVEGLGVLDETIRGLL